MSASATLAPRVAASAVRSAARDTGGCVPGHKHELGYCTFVGARRVAKVNSRRRLATIKAYLDDQRTGNANEQISENTNDATSFVNAFATHLASVTDPVELYKLLDLLPPKLKDALHNHPRRLSLLEVVLDLGRVPIARFVDGDQELSSEVLTYDDIEVALNGVGEVGGDNRAGVNKTLHRVSVIRNRGGNVVGLTCRVGRAIEGSADLVSDLLQTGVSILLLGRPGVGKTTAIREISRVLSEQCRRRVVIVDTSNEIGGDGDIPHPGIGSARRMQVPSPDSQHHVLIEAVQNHTPEVVIVDEIGTELEAQAARTISQRGVQMIATAHGHTLENLLKNPTLNDLVGGVVSVTLGDDEARRRRVQKSVLEREGPPTFGVAVEMLEIGKWRVHLDVGVAVDTLLAGYEPHVEIRAFDEVTGSVIAQPWLGDGVGGGGLFGSSSNGVAGSTNGNSVAGPFGFGGVNNPGQSIPSPTYQSYDRILGGWGNTGAGPPVGASNGIIKGKKEICETSSGLAAREVSEAAERRSENSSVSQTTSTSSFSSEDDYLLDGIFRIYPHELDCDVVEEVITELGLSDRCVLTSVLEEASAVLAVKSRVKNATWLRHAARARGMPIYALKAEGMPQLARAVQAMLGLNALENNQSEKNGAKDGDTGGDANGAQDSVSSSNSPPAKPSSQLSVKPSGVPNNTSVASSPTPAEETDALEEVRMAVEQLVIPHQEPVELLPRDRRLLKMQADLIANEYSLQYEECGEGNARRIRILHTYAEKR